MVLHAPVKWADSLINSMDYPESGSPHANRGSKCGKTPSLCPGEEVDSDHSKRTLHKTSRARSQTNHLRNMARAPRRLQTLKQPRRK
jgi:hypothetical protein